jgi:hypothetical protein
MASLYQELDVGVHEWNGHGHSRPIWEHEVRILAETLDHAEDVVPPTAVKARAVVAELIDDLVM